MAQSLLDPDTKASPSSSQEGVDSKKKGAEHIEHRIKGDLSDFDDSIELTRPSKAVWLITFTVAMGGFLFGNVYSHGFGTGC